MNGQPVYIRKLYGDGDRLRIFACEPVGEIKWYGAMQQTATLTVVSDKRPAPHRVLVVGKLVKQILCDLSADAPTAPESNCWPAGAVLRVRKTRGETGRNEFEWLAGSAA